MSPCSTPLTMSKKPVSPSEEQTFTFVFLYSIIMAVTVSLGRREVFAPSSFCVWSKRPRRSRQKILLPQDLSHVFILEFDR